MPLKSCKHRSKISVKKLDGYFEISFVARFSFLQQYTIAITIDGVNIPQTPLVISVTNNRPVTTAVVQQKLSTLYKSLQHHRKRGLSTQTVDRDHVLNSALRVLSSDNISYLLRVRFDNESGMDIGGLSK